MAGDRARGLGERFLALLPPDRRPVAPAAGLEEVLTRALEEARAAWPEVQLSDADFLRHLAARLPADREVAAAIPALFVSDLYLACACARGDERALACFDRDILSRSAGAWSGGHPLAAFADEVRQALRVRLFVAEEGAPPRIATYSGRGPLAAWVRMSATRLGLNLRKRERGGSRDPDEVQALRSSGLDPELEYLKTRYAAELREALVATLAALSERSANVLRLHYQEGATIDAIGTMYRVSGRTVHRWLAEARQLILAETRRILRERLGLADSQLDSLIGLVRSRLDLSIYRYLRPGAGRP